MVKILDRYVFTEMAKYFFLSLLTFIVLFVVIDFVSHVDSFLKIGTAKGILYVIYRVPLYTVRTIPIATLIATMVTLARFSSSSELIVVKSLGISLYRFSVPIIIFALLSSIASFLIGELVVPESLSLAEEIRYEFKGEKSVHVFGNSAWFRKGNNVFAFVEKVNPKTFEAERISIIFLGKDFVPTKRIDARYGINVKDGTWNLKNCFEVNLLNPRMKYYPEKELNLGIGKKDIIFTRIEPETIDVFSLYHVIKQFRKVGYNVRNYLVDLYSKFAISFLPLIVTFIGIPLGVFNPRNRKGYTLVIAAAIIVLMWITISSFISLGKGGLLPPIYAAFAPEFMFLSVGLILLSRMET